MGFNLYKAFPNGGRIEIMEGYVKQSDHDDLITIAHFFAQQGKMVQIPAVIHFKSFTPPFKKEKIRHMISNGLLQASHIIINNNKGAEDYFILQTIHNRVLYARQNVDEVWLFKENEVRLLFKKQIGD